MKEKKDATTGSWEGMEVKVADEELREFLKVVLIDRPYVPLSEGMKTTTTIGNLYKSRERVGDLDFVYLNLGEQASLFGVEVLMAAAAAGRQEGNYFSLESKEEDGVLEFWISVDDLEVNITQFHVEDHFLLCFLICHREHFPAR